MPLLWGPAIALQREKPQGFLFPKGEFLRTHRVGPLGLSGSLFLILLVLDFYHPTNRDLYSPKLSEGSHLFECSLSFILLISKFYPPYEANFFDVLLCGCGVGVGVVWCGVVWGVFTSEIF